MTINDTFRALIANEIKKREIYSKVGVVSEIDESARTCTVTPVDGTAKMYDVRLQSNISGSVGLVQIPQNGSNVVISYFSKNTAYVSLYTEIAKILIDTDLVE